MKILKIIATLSAGGAETLATNLAIEYSKCNADVKFFLTAGIRGHLGENLHQRLTDNAIEVLGIQNRRPARISNIIKIASILNTWKPDIVHCHLYSSEIALALSRPFWRNKRRPLMVRTLHSTKISGSKSPWIANRVRRIFDCSVACSVSVEDSYKAFFNCLTDNKVNTISNGSCLASDAPAADEKAFARHALALDDDCFVIVNVGGFRGNSICGAQKGHDVLLKALPGILKKRQKVCVLFAGDGPLLSEAKQLASQLAVRHAVRFLGNVPDPWQLLRAADVFCMPSRHEGLSIALLEAGSIGIPVVASKIPEIIRICPGKSWVLFTKNDTAALEKALETVLLNYETYKEEASEDAKVIRNKYTIERCAESYLNLFHEKSKQRHLNKR
ncbi:MAG: glycosyltransferase [Desulfobacteraceae bacterium]|nr:glycosyltransferase [Desulfobacteraceae bacterium]